MEQKLTKVKKSNKKVKKVKGKAKEESIKNVQISRRDSLRMVVGMLHNILSARYNVPEKGITGNASVNFDLSARVSNLNPVDLASFKLLRRDLVRQVYGAQVVKLQLRSVQFTVATAVGGILSSVVTMQYTSLSNNADLTNVFDEVRFGKKNIFWFYPTGVATNYGQGVGVVDYDDATPLASVNGALSYDTARIVNLFPALDVADAEKTSIQWNCELIGQPDDVWNTTQGYTAGVAWLKFYNFNSPLPSSTTAGYAGFVSTVIFRQTD